MSGIEMVKVPRVFEGQNRTKPDRRERIEGEQSGHAKQ